MIAVDVEGSGVEAHKHSVLSVGAIDMGDPTRQFYEVCRAWDGAHLDMEAFAVNGFTKETATDPTKQTEAELVKKFIAWTDGMADTTFAAQNVSYDRDFLRYAGIRAGHIAWPFAHRAIDIHSMAWLHMVKRGVTPPIDPVKRHSALDLDAILVYCGVPEEPTPHNALTGAKCHAEVISRLLYDKKLLPEFERYDIPWK